MSFAPETTVIAGGGVAGLEAVLALREVLGRDAPIALVSADETFRFRPLAVGEPFGLGTAHRHQIAPIARDLGVTFLRDVMTGVDTAGRRLRLASGAAPAYARLVVAVGAPTRAPCEHGVLFDRVTNGPAFDAVIADLQSGVISRVAFAVGAGVSWPLPAYELALMAAAWGAAARQEPVEVVITTGEPTPLALFGPAASTAVTETLRRAGVTFHGGADPVLESDVLAWLGDRPLHAERIVVLPEHVGPQIPGLPADERGFVPVDPWGRVPGAERVFAIGDAAAHPIKQGGLAAQQAVTASRAIAADLGLRDDADAPRPVLRGLLRTAEGPLYLRAALDDVAGTSIASGEPLWWPPSKLAAPRLTSYLARVERSRAEGRVLPTGGFAHAGNRSVNRRPVA